MNCMQSLNTHGSNIEKVSLKMTCCNEISTDQNNNVYLKCIDCSNNKKSAQMSSMRTGKGLKKGPVYRRTKRDMNKLWYKLKQYKDLRRDPEYFISEYFETIQTKIDLKREQFKQLIDDYYDNLLKELFEQKTACLNSINQVLSQQNENFVTEYDILSEEMMNDHVLDESKLNELVVKINKNLNNVQSKLDELKCLLLNEKEYNFKSKSIQLLKEDVLGELSVKFNRLKPFNGNKKLSINGHTEGIMSMILLENGDLASGSADDTIKIWNPSDGSLRSTLTGHTNSVTALKVLPNGDLVSGSADDSIRIWDINSGKLKMTLIGHSYSISSLVVLGNGDLASSSGDWSIKIWNVKEGTLKKTLNGHTGWVRCLSLMKNQDLISGSDDKSIKIWNITNGKERKTLIGHLDGVYCMVLLPNGNLATGSLDSTIKIWDIYKETVKFTLQGHSGVVCSLVILRNNFIASSSDDKTIKIWNIEEKKS